MSAQTPISKGQDVCVVYEVLLRCRAVLVWNNNKKNKCGNQHCVSFTVQVLLLRKERTPTEIIAAIKVCTAVAAEGREERGEGLTKREEKEHYKLVAVFVKLFRLFPP